MHHSSPVKTSAASIRLSLSCKIRPYHFQEQYQFLYKALEGAFPVQNGEVKQVKSAAVASVEIVNETKAGEAEKQPEEKKAEEPASTTSSNQQAEAESTPLVAESEKEKKEEEPAKESTPQEESSNGPTVTVEVWDDEGTHLFLSL